MNSPVTLHTRSPGGARLHVSPKQTGLRRHRVKVFTARVLSEPDIVAQLDVALDVLGNAKKALLWAFAAAVASSIVEAGLSGAVVTDQYEVKVMNVDPTEAGKVRAMVIDIAERFGFEASYDGETKPQTKKNARCWKCGAPTGAEHDYCDRHTPAY